MDNPPPSGLPAGQSAPIGAPLPARRSGPNWWLIGGLGCAGLILLFVVIPLATIVFALFVGSKAGPSAVPTDFPVYPGAKLFMAIGSDKWGTSAAWTTDDSIDSVDAFYQQALSQSPWQITGPAPGARGWRFQRIQGHPARGEVRFSQQGGQTDIQLVLLRASSSG